MYKEPCKEGDVVGDKARVRTRGYDEVGTCRITESPIEGRCSGNMKDGEKDRQKKEYSM